MIKIEANYKRHKFMALLAITIICLLPSFLNLLGVSFESFIKPLDINFLNTKYFNQAELTNKMFQALAGGLHHALLEWSSVIIALITVIFSFAHYRVNNDITVPIIGMALLSSGFVDAFHTLVATRLIDSTANPQDLIPFTWALSRGFHALVIITGVLLVLAFKRNKKEIRNKYNFSFVILISFIFIGIAYISVHISATSNTLPQTQFPLNYITRPFDVLPLLILVLAIPLFYKLDKSYSSLFTAGLLISLIPDIILEAHMAFGSSRLFDNHFNIAHFLKIIAYLIPLMGLLADYIQTHLTLKAEISGRKRYQEELIKEKNRVEKLASSKSEFLANMSHEIRTPLNGILGMVSLLRDSQLNESQTEMLETIKSCGDGLLTVLNDVLDFSKIESGKLELELVNFNLKKCIDEVIYLVSFKAKQKNLTLRSDIHKEVPHFLYGDITRIRQILVNFMSNAVKFMSNAVKFTEEGSVTISVKLLEKNEKDLLILFQVLDTGIGIKKENQSKLFSAFSQADNSTTRRFGGTGLGLSISAKLTEFMHGEIKLESEEGIGSTFSLYLPLKVGENTSKDSEIFQKSDKVKKQVSPISNYFPHKILVVEDNNVNQKLAILMLRKLGYECEVAGNGQEALELLKIKKYTLIFMDMQMPVMDGLTTTKEIICQYEEKRPKIVAMTANAFAEDKEKCLEAGMDDFIAKPIEISELARVIANYGKSSTKKNSPKPV